LAKHPQIQERSRGIDVADGGLVSGQGAEVVEKALP
jgi:hypothetical protein